MAIGMDIDQERLREIEQELGPSARAVLEECPQFRILVTGKAGVGKTSLIRKTFGVDHLNVSDATPVSHDINSPIGSPTNPYFIVHDSQGYEYGGLENQQIVLDFIKDRAEQPLLKDRLHAIWLCVAVPYANARAFEAADIEILRLEVDVPIVVVFTKYDKLVGAIVCEVEDEHLEWDEKRINEEAQNRALSRRKELCEDALPQVLASPNPPYPITYVSTNEGYESSISDIGRITMNQIARSVWLVWAVAQRANADLNIEQSIRMGGKSYWKGLTSDIVIGSKFTDWLVLIHRDIVKVWNFEDPNKLLDSEPFMSLMSHIVADLGDTPNSNPAPRSRMTDLANAATIATVYPPAAPIMVGIAGIMAAASWIKEKVQQNGGTLGRLMGYIIDLTIVMQSVFGLLNHPPGVRAPVTRRLVNLALKAYVQSPHKRQDVHNDIRTLVSKKTLQRFNTEYVVGEITRLIETHRFVPDEQYLDRMTIKDSDSESAADEPWLKPGELVAPN